MDVKTGMSPIFLVTEAPRKGGCGLGGQQRGRIGQGTVRHGRPCWERIGRHENKAFNGRPARVPLGATSGMTALALTIFVSLGLAVFFVGLFLLQASEGAGNPRDALLPLEADAQAVESGPSDAREI